MSVIEFPGSPDLPLRPITEAEVDKLHSEAFCDLEGEVCDLELAGEISQQLIMQCTVGREDSMHQLALAQFAVLQLAKMVREFKANYYKRWHGEAVES